MQRVAKATLHGFNDALCTIGNVQEVEAYAMHDALSPGNLIGGDRSTRAKRIVCHIGRLIYPVGSDKIEKLRSAWKGCPLAAITKLDARKRFHPGKGRIIRRRKLEALAAVRKHLRPRQPGCQQYQ